MTNSLPSSLENEDRMTREQMEEPFPRYFSLEEAARLVIDLAKRFEEIHQDLGTLKDRLVLQKRLAEVRADQPTAPEQNEENLLQSIWQEYEEAFQQYGRYFLSQGILLRDLEKGLVDFPYKAQDGNIYLLCWHTGEDGIFYFHRPEDGFRGRVPITLLPE